MREEAKHEAGCRPARAARHCDAPGSELALRPRGAHAQVVIIDTDTASDDAVALIMALRARGVTVVAITVVAGNVSLPQASRNARFTVELCGASVPVYEGAARPLLREPHTAQFFHGQDGLGDQGYPPPRTPPRPATRSELSSTRSTRTRGFSW